MKTTLLAAAAVLGLGLGNAHAGEGNGSSLNKLSASLPGKEPDLIGADRDDLMSRAYVTAHNTGTWLFALNSLGGGMN